MAEITFRSLRSYRLLLYISSHHEIAHQNVTGSRFPAGQGISLQTSSQATNFLMPTNPCRPVPYITIFLKYLRVWQSNTPPRLVLPSCLRFISSRGSHNKRNLIGLKVASYAEKWVGTGENIEASYVGGLHPLNSTTNIHTINLKHSARDLSA